MKIRGQEVLDPKARLMNKVIINPKTGCWMWQGASKGKGYGILTVGSRTDGTRRTVSAYGYSMLVFRGLTLPKGQEWCHKCDTPPCINPDHLFPGTRQDNIADREAKGRSVVLRGEKNGFSKLTLRGIEGIKERHRHGESHREIAKVFGVHHTTVGDILRGQSWLPAPPEGQ